MPVKLYVLKSHHWREKISGNLSLQPQWWKISNQIKLALEFHIFNYFSHFNKMISLHWINLLSLNMLQSSKKCKKLHPKEHLISNYINIFTNFSDLALNADIQVEQICISSLVEELYIFILHSQNSFPLRPIRFLHLHLLPSAKRFKPDRAVWFILMIDQQKLASGLSRVIRSLMLLV